ncbi:alkaline phosphatase [Histoplasma capsulatum G186AR]|uniref:alkaline phosphatase n=2 Tax=Ajellomyces capsulatus TaxID=5037 RepID=C0NP90_AJECG|nr:alkaline phosphatase [Histoplasma capsulatum G186AR]EEH06750.1 alkaline phosphatase [Histoplasma capsulatum G186AR]
MKLPWIVGAVLFSSTALAQTFQRLGGCPELGCVFPPDQTDFLAGQYFDIRLEVHSPVNGSEAREGEPDPNFTFAITKKGRNNKPQAATEFFGVEEPELEKWDFTWYEDLFARDAKKPSLVKVASKVYRRVALYQPGEYEATLTYYDGKTTTATWLVRDLAEVRKAKNVILFIGDGMTTNMITAARMIAHRSVNGRFQSRMQMDKFPVLGHQMTHSLDSIITDSANSATSLYTGHKTTVNALGVYRDSSPSPFDDPKFETIAEIFHRVYPNAGIGIVTTAHLSDATPAALTAHTKDRGQAGHVIDSYFHGLANYSWTKWDGPDVLFGGGAEDFLPERAYLGQNYYKLFAEKGYSVSWNKTALAEAPNTEKALGVFSTSVMAKWLDRNIYTDNLKNKKNYPDGSDKDADDQPGLKDMTLKAIDILTTRSCNDGFFLMSEAASIDKQMHVLDYDRALGELLELDDTIRATIEKLRSMKKLDETLILVTADHGHGFDVMGTVDTEYLNAQDTDRAKRDAIGVYEASGLSQYTVQTEGSFRYSEGVHFPAQWDPRYSLFSGLTANPDRRENYQVHKDGPRLPAVTLKDGSEDYYVNYKDAVSGFVINGTLSVSEAQGVHSLTDVPVFAMGPCQEEFGGVYNNIDIFFNIANCLGLGKRQECI